MGRGAVLSIDFDCSNNGFSSVRYYSWVNPWIDFIVLVQSSFEDRALEIVRNAMDEYWESDDMCYGDVVERWLLVSKIPYMIFYHSEEKQDEAYESEWERLIQKLPEGYVIPD